jgi:hypothetical protein
LAGNKRLTDLIDYTTVLPFDSELFGIYQPLLGWKSKRIADRFGQGFAADKRSLLDRLKNQFTGQVDLTYDPDCRVRIAIRPGSALAGKIRTFDSIVLDKVAEKLPPYDEYRPELWPDVINRDRIETIFTEFVTPTYSDYYAEQCRRQGGERALVDVGRQRELVDSAGLFRAAFEHRLRYESSTAGLLLHLADEKRFDELATIFYAVANHEALAGSITKILGALQAIDGYVSLDTLDPQDKADLERVALSPISVVHLFREYFFELDSFLGTPVSHVWLSPGSTVELIEISTRRTYIEKTVEEALETVTKAETETVEEDELSDAVKQDNKQDVKFGASVTASYASVTATSSFDYGTSQQTAREETHKRTRRQTEKLSSEIRKNFKSTFKTITETTDTSSKRYTLANATPELINYELRRKMRQVAVQVQDVGTYLCWQTYVDDPGASLGIAKLVHIAKPADLDGLHAPEEIPLLQPFPEQRVVTLPFISIEDTDADNEGEVYKDGVEVDDSEFLGSLEKVQSDFPVEFVCPKGGYELASVEFDGQGKPVSASLKGDISNADNKSTFTLHLDSVDFQGQNSVQVQVTLHWTPAPGANDGAIKANDANKAAFKAKEEAEYQKAYVANAKERIKLLHQITSRPSDELREEERIVVYRKLIQDMLMNGISMPDDRTRHVVAELINAIFDVDKMLYFVAPEWWRPRLRQSRQHLDESSSLVQKPFSQLDPSISFSISTVEGVAAKVSQTASGLAKTSKSYSLSSSTVGWGGADDPWRDNYYITEDSRPARFGSSLGWLLQLDGDNMRNAFLNAPWVKAVIPIRPGKEQAAINWLKSVEGFNGIDDTDIYETDNPNEKDIDGNPLDGQKMIDVLMDLAKKIQKKHEEGIKNGKYPKQDEVADPQLVDEDNVVTATPIDRVYEHGFYPLAGGFRANVQANYEIFDQWLEVVPTDQIVPVEVKYDPKTGRQM